MRRPRALCMQERVIAHFGGLGWRLLPCGPLRRGADTIERVELLLDLGQSPEPDWPAFLRQVPDAGAVDAPQRSVCLTMGEVLKFYRSPADSLGFALIAHTGPADFVQRLRRRPGWDLVPATTEEDAFARVGLPWIAPTLRALPDVIELAEQGYLPEEPPA